MGYLFSQTFICYAVKVPYWYVVQVSDTTTLPIAASLFGQKIIYNLKIKNQTILCDFAGMCLIYTLNSAV